MSDAPCWIVGRGELLDPGEFTMDPVSECLVVAAEEYGRLVAENRELRARLEQCRAVRV